MTRPRALLTGRSGFTGRYLARELEQRGYEVFGICHERTDDPGSRKVDLLERAAVADAVASIAPDVVVHLAAISFVAHGDADDVYRVNVVGTRNLLQALQAAEKTPEIVVLASSANVYGNTEIEPIIEDTPLAPANDYAVSKLAMEYMARIWMDKLPIVITRPFNYTGVGQDERFLIPKIVSHYARREKVIELGNIDVYRDFSDVRDVARAYAILVQRCEAVGTLNICSGRGYSIRDVLGAMSNISGHEIEVRVNPQFVRKNEVERLVGSAARMKEILGEPNAIGLEQTLSWMYEVALEEHSRHT